MKERNYTIEFFRFMFAVNFVLIHACMIFPLGFLKGFPLFVNGFDVIIPFMAFSGYFLMHGYKKKQLAQKSETSAARQAWDYLKGRLIALMPVFLFAQSLGFVANRLWQGTPISQWPAYFFNAIGEFAGIQITGIGLGNASVGVWGTAAPVNQLLNTPIWFISGIFVLGYFVYYLIAKSEKNFVGFIAPIGILLFFGSQYIAGDVVPMWTDHLAIGSFNIATGLLNMFCGLSIGVLLWVACDNLKGKKFSKGMINFMTICQIVLVFIVFAKSWISITNPFMTTYLNIGWGPMYILTTIFSFFVLLNVDKCSRFRLFSSKIWALPGKLSFYIYMLHFPIIVFTGMAMGLKGAILTPETAPTLVPQVFMMFGIALVLSILIGYIVMKIDTAFIQPWLKKKPWYTSEQAKQELAAIK